MWQASDNITISTNTKFTTAAATAFNAYAFKYAMSYHEPYIMMYAISHESVIIETMFVIFLSNRHTQF